VFYLNQLTPANGPERLPISIHALAGCMAGLTTVPIVTPVEQVRHSVQSNNQSIKQTISKNHQSKNQSNNQTVKQSHNQSINEALFTPICNQSGRFFGASENQSILTQAST
jgi:hypothetical protein